MRERTFSHPSGTLSLRSEDGALYLKVQLLGQSKEDPKTEKVMVRYAAFPSVIGYGDSLAEAREKHLALFWEYVDTFLELNGVDGLVSHLRELGFGEEGSEPGHDDEGWRAVPGAVIEQSRRSTARL